MAGRAIERQMGTILGLVLPAIPTLVSLAEKLFTKPTAGTDKMSAVVSALRGMITQLVASGSVPPTPDGKPVAQPTDDALMGAVEAVLNQLKSAGTLGTVVDSGNIYLVRGTVTPLKVG